VKNLKLLCVLCLALLCAGSMVAETNAAASTKPTSDDCLACHNDGSMVNGKAVHGDAFKASVHGSMFSCVDCHTGIKSLPHGANLTKPTCNTCHAVEQKSYDTGAHGKALVAGNSKVPNCEGCHGNIHEILPASDPKSRDARANIPVMCGQCHSQPIPGFTADVAVAYQESVHGKLVASGNVRAAVCSDCHRAHDILPPSDPSSPVYRSNIPKTCGECHASDEAIFDNSIHGQALDHGNPQAPVCTSCHGVHIIQAVNNKASLVSPQNQGNLACGQCHNNVRMTEDFGIPGGREDTYRYSYHGMANAEGSTRTAICSSCHGTHDILPSSDPASTINPANLRKTCGQCHPGANANFAKGKIHLNPAAAYQADFGSKVVEYVRKFYIVLIVVVIGFMLLHNIIIFVHKTIEHKKSDAIHHAGGPRVVVRMTMNQRIQHFLLFVSFLLLVITGFALKYHMATCCLVINETVRRNIHRVAGTLLILVSLYHIVYLAFYPEGRRMLMDMLPELKDATDMVDVFNYYLGFSDRKPQFKRFNYAEKMEYWALVWGTFIMALTGLMIWFKFLTTDILPRWWIDVATTVHFYEAILATLAILVWHFYQVILDPDTYPVNFAFMDGKMSLEHYQEEHGLDSATLSQYAGVAGDDVNKKPGKGH
jgi:formate dehydrogenase gamma subunit